MQTQSNFKTPLDKIFFRASAIGALMSGLTKHGLTDKQKEEKAQLEAITSQAVGLSDKQQSDLDKLNKKKEEGGTLTQVQEAKREDFTARLNTFRTLYPAQEKRLNELVEKENKPPELSKGAKTFIEDVWLENEKGFRVEVTDKKLKKGIKAEIDARNLISYTDGIMYRKNDKRVTKENITGECDIIDNRKADGIHIRLIHDLKCSWNPRTFMNAELSPIYEWQGRAYMYLYDADFFFLRYCLVDCPPDILAEEYKKFCFDNIIDDSAPQYKELIDQFYRNYQYADSGRYTQEERVKTFFIERDEEKEKLMHAAVKLAIEYYQTITLNKIDRPSEIMKYLNIV